MKISVIGCGRWGSFQAWHAAKILNHEVVLYGRESSANMKRLEENGGNEYLKLPENVRLSKNLEETLNFAEVVIISVGAQNLRSLVREIKNFPGVSEKKFVLCMKGLESGTGKRLTTVFNEEMHNSEVDELQPIKRDDFVPSNLTSVFGNDLQNSNFANEKISLKDEVNSPVANLMTDLNIVKPAGNVAVWAGPGHVQDFVAGIPNCMVISSASENLTHELVEIFKSPLIRFYYGKDLIGTEIGAAAKNVMGLAAGMLDGLNRTSLKGALMARGTAELSRLVAALGGDKMTIYGLSHLGDYEATLFSKHSHNRQFGEDFVKGKKFDKLAEGVETAAALMKLSEMTGEELPISKTVYEILHKGRNPEEALMQLFLRSVKAE